MAVTQCPGDLGAELTLLGTAAFLMSNQALSAAVSACYIPWERKIVLSLSELRQI